VSHHTSTAPTIGDRVRTGLRGLGQTLITLGVIMLLFVVYELWFTDVVNAREQHKIKNALENTWQNGVDPLHPTAAPSTAPTGPSGPPSDGASPTEGDDDPVVGPTGHVSDIPIGSGIAIIRIPKFGLGWNRVVVEGTGQDELAEGPGHYPGSALPGEIGNMSIAGHRVSRGSPFLDLDKLNPGDAIVIETKDYWYTYRVLGNPKNGSFTEDTPDGIPGREIVSPSQNEVVAPVPDHPGQTPTLAMLTLTTCHPKFSASQRMILHAELDGKPLAKGPGVLPPALQTKNSGS
jgi:sortase A